MVTHGRLTAEAAFDLLRFHPPNLQRETSGRRRRADHLRCPSTTSSRAPPSSESMEDNRMMQSFVANRHGRLVFPSNFQPNLDFSVIETKEQLDRVIRRDFETKAPTGTDMMNRVAAGRDVSRYELMRDVALNLFWVNRFALTMDDKYPVRWRDVTRTREDMLPPIVAPWLDRDAKVDAVARGYRNLPPTWNETSEDRFFAELFDVFGHRTFDATRLPSIKPTVAEALTDPASLTFTLADYDPRYLFHSYEDFVDVTDEVPELEALQRWSMVLHNQYPWDLSKVRLTAVRDLHDDDMIILFVPWSGDVLRFVRRMKAAAAVEGGGTVVVVDRAVAATKPVVQARSPIRPYPVLDVGRRFAIQPRIEERRYTARDSEEISLGAAREALAQAGREPEDIGAVLFCSCTSSRLIPSALTWLTGQLGMQQTHASVDLIAACAGPPYGLSEAVRLLQEVDRPVLLVCAEKFSDNIGWAGAHHRLPRPTSRPTSPAGRPRPRVGRHRHSVRGLSVSSAAMNPRIPA